MALAGTVLALSGPGQTAGFAVFIDPMIADLGISRSVVSAAYMVGTLAGAVSLPWIGRAVDRYGVRPTLVTVALGFAAFLLLLATTREVFGLTAGFVGARALGQGGVTMIATTAVGIAVTRNRGTALGVTSAIGTAGISLFPLLAERLIALLGWRMAFVVESGMVLAIIVPIAWWGMRGLRRGTSTDTPDPGRGARGDSSGATDETPPASPTWPMRAVLRTSMFWAIASVVTCSGLVSTAVFFHLVAILGEQGLSPTQAAATFLPQTLAGLLASLLFSSATDRFSPKVLLSIAMGAHAVTLALLPVVSPGVSALAFGAALGAAGAAARAVEAAAFPYYYGTEILGTLRGMSQSLAVASTAVAPLILSLGHDIVGAYAPVVLGLAVLPAVIALAVPFARPPRARSAPPEQPASA
ncbi:MFS transporter [Lipingzhangella sp. LS1_29]|uniref:MFS transporter n=1 Tax=Lipingzhangella rawalii TaxID=2055835 RepID=A0ABU2H4R3_9ACTN|nr:MFS transporter [Lipingzhangella rawalii]MDS1270298.1 MFS transporter [Lipingzhangella rawalii]